MEKVGFSRSLVELKMGYLLWEQFPSWLRLKVSEGA